MPRRSLRDVMAARQTSLVGADKHSVLIADLIVELLRLRMWVAICEDVPTHVSRETAHTKRLKDFLTAVQETASSDFELEDTEVDHEVPSAKP